MSDSTYDLESIRLPRFAGGALKAFVGLIESPATRWLLIGQLLDQGGITMLRKLQLDEPPTYLPHYPAGSTRGRPPSPRDLEKLRDRAQIPPGFAHASIGDYATAYRRKAATPVEVAEKVLAAIEASNAATPPLRAIIACDPEDVRTQARQSAERIRTGKPRGVLEGVPFAVKDEMDAPPYPTTVGTRFLGKSPAAQDAAIVARLRAAGALIIGKANMHEIGIGVTGHNAHHGTPRNPHAPDHYTGGSSSGSAAATAAGLCAGATGADGGGSIRIPSAFCGLVGLKTTFGRTSSFGAAPLTWSNDQLGPIAASVTDLAILYALTAGPDPSDPVTLDQPPVSLEGFDRPDLKGLTLGVYRPWFEHAAPEVVAACQALLEALQARGAKVREVTIPELDAARIGHLVSITSEMLTALARYKEHFKEYSLEVRTNLTLAKAFSASDYLQALRIRTRTMAHFNRALAEVDALVTPMTGITAPPIRPDALPLGESDLTTLLEIMRFATPANLTGLPAISFPAGYDSTGLPVGFQAMAKPWHEHVLLRIARVAESVVERRAPQVRYPLL